MYLQRRRPGKSDNRAIPRLEELESRLVLYSVSGNSWLHPQLITISFVPDGTVLSGSTTSNLMASFNAKFGSAAAWENIILKAAQTWAAQTNINFAVVPDSGAAIGSGSYQQGDPTMGDIRIGGFAMGASNPIIAQAYMPTPANNQSAAGDIQFNTSRVFNINGSTYDLFTVAEHEIGHALGLNHNTSLPTAVMYPNYTGVKSSLNADDIAGIRSIYSNGQARTGDIYNANDHSFANAANLTSLISTTTDTGLVSGLDHTAASDADYFTFTAPTGTNGTFTLNLQSAGLSLFTPGVTIYAADQSTVLGSVTDSGVYGATLSVTINGVTAGEQFYVKVTGADSTVFSTGAYALAMNFGTNSMPTVPVANTTTANGNPLQGGGGVASEVLTESLVNTYTSTTQAESPSGGHTIATNAVGGYVVVWSSQNQDGSGWGVYARLYNAAGIAQGSPFLVNTTTSGDQMYPSVAMDAAGAFVVTWSSNGQDGSGWGVYAQRYSATGVAQGGEFRVNTTTSGDQEYSAVAMDTNGDFVITWQSNGQDGSNWGIYAQRYNSSGVAQGGEFRVNTTTSGNQEYPSIAADSLGDFIVTWSSDGGQDGNGWGVYAQRYSLLGIALGGEFRVNTTTAGDQEYSSVAMDGSGDFVITWSSGGQDGGGLGVYAQRYNYLGIAQAGEFRVNTTTTGDQTYPDVAMDSYGNFIIAWQSYGQDASNTWGIYDQQYSFLGLGLGTESLVNTTTAGDQVVPSVALSNSGIAVVDWSGNGVGDTSGIFTQLYTLNNDALDDLLVTPPGPIVPVQGRVYHPQISGYQAFGNNVATADSGPTDDLRGAWQHVDFDGSGIAGGARFANVAALDVVFSGVAEGSEVPNLSTARDVEFGIDWSATDVALQDCDWLDGIDAVPQSDSPTLTQFAAQQV